MSTWESERRNVLLAIVAIIVGLLVAFGGIALNATGFDHHHKEYEERLDSLEVRG